MSRRELTTKELAAARNAFTADMVPDTKWQKGVSGNPSGKSAEPDDLIELLRYHLGKAGARSVVKNWISIAKGLGDGVHPVPYNVQLAAATSLYDRLVGRPRQADADDDKQQNNLVVILQRLISDDKALAGHTIAAPPSRLIDAGEVREVAGSGTQS